MERSIAFFVRIGATIEWVAEIYEKKNDKAAFRQVLKEGAEKHQNYAPLLTKLSEYCLNLGDYEGAYRYAAMGLKLEENDTLLYNVGLYLFRKVTQNIHISVARLQRCSWVLPQSS